MQAEIIGQIDKWIDIEEMIESNTPAEIDESMNERINIKMFLICAVVNKINQIIVC